MAANPTAATGQLSPAVGDPEAENNAVVAWQNMDEQLKVLIDQQRASQRALQNMVLEQIAVLSRMSEYSQMQMERCKMPLDDQSSQAQGPDRGGECPFQGTATPHSVRPLGSEVDGGPASTWASEIVKKEDSDSPVQHHVNYGAFELAEAGGKDFRLDRDGSIVRKSTTFREQPKEWLHVLAESVLNWRFFEPSMGLFIILNALNIGWAIDQELINHEKPEGEQVRGITIIFEHVLLGIFTVELLLRMYVSGIRRCLTLPWNLLDFVLVSFAYLELVVEAIIRDLSTRGLLKQVLILRMFRILRLARAVRLVKKFKSLWRLVQGLLNCWGTMLSAFTLMLGATFLFGCFGAELITKPWRGDPALSDTIEDRFSTMPKIMLTLFQFITMDSIADFYWELVLREPILVIYFMLLLVVVSIALMNLVTAMLVEEAIMNQRMDEDMAAFYTRQRLKELDPKIRQLFSRFDVGGNRMIRMQEVLLAMENGMKIPKELQAFVNHARIVDLFDALDKDQSGEISEDEFVEGLGYMAMSDVPLETMQILHLVRLCAREMVKVKRELRSKSALFPIQASRVATPAVCI